MARRILTERERERFIELYPTTPNKQLEIIFSMDKTAIYQTASDLDVRKSKEYFQMVQHANNGRAWSEEELQILKDNYLYYSDLQLTKLLPNRNKGSIGGKRMQLGLYKTLSKDEIKERIKEKNKFIKSNDILIHNTKQSIDNVLKLYDVTEKIADKI